ncbi:MAG: hypothetical protein WBN57_13860, partial [Gammaproteobacteria bacterium]
AKYMSAAARETRTELHFLPDCLAAPILSQLERSRVIHKMDIDEGQGEVQLPFALARKYSNAGKE